MSVKILTVDDSPAIRATIARIFRSFDCDVVEAHNGAAGLSAAREEKPDVILLDYSMPIMDGCEMLSHLRADSELANTPVIVLSSETGRDMVTKISKLGIRDYLLKPVTEELLVERVGRVITLSLKKNSAEHSVKLDDANALIVVDENPLIIDQIRNALTGTNWEVIGFDHPDKALGVCLKKSVAAVLVSLALPSNGVAGLLKDLKSYIKTATVPVFGLSNDPDLSIHQAKPGFAGILLKPDSAEDWNSRINGVLSLRKHPVSHN